MAGDRRIAALFYELRAKTEGLQADLIGAQRNLEKFSQFVIANPVASLGALAAAALAAGAKMVQASEQIEQSFRRIQAALPQGADLGPLREEVNQLANQFGVSRTEILKTAEANAVYSKSASEAAERTRAVFLAQQAGKGDAQTLAAEYDQVADAFNLTGTAASEAFAKVVQISKGANSAAETFASLQRAAPGLQTMGISLDTALQALVTINEKGLNPKQAGAYFTKLVEGGAQGAKILRDLAAQTPGVSNALQQLQRDADTASAGIARSTGQIKARLEELMVTIGSRLAPFVADQLSILNAQLAELGGDVGPKVARAVRQITSATDGDAAGQFALTKQAFDRLLDGFNTLTLRSIKNLGASLRSESDASLAKLATNISRFKLSDLTSPEDTKNAQRILDLIFKIQQERNLASQLADRVGAAKPSGLPTAPKSVAEQEAEAEKAAKAAEELANARTAATAFGESLAALSGKSDAVLQVAKSFGELRKSIADAANDAKLKSQDLKLQPAVRQGYADLATQLQALLPLLSTAGERAKLEAGAKQFVEGRRALFEVIGTSAEVAEAQVDALVQSLRQKGNSDDQIEQARKLAQALADAKVAGGELTKVLRAQDSDRNTSNFAKSLDLIARQKQLQQEINDLHGDDVTTEQTREEKERQIAALQAQIAKLSGETAENTAAATTAAEGFATQLNDALSAAFGIISALAGADAGITKLVGGALQFADGIAKAVKATKDLGGLSSIFSSSASLFAALPGIGQAIGGAIGIGSTIASLLGESPEEKARREVLEKNTAALQDLATKIGDISRLSSSGKTISGVRSAVNSVVDAPLSIAQAFHPSVLAKELQAALVGAGVSLEDLRKVASDLGITLSEKPTIPELRELQKAINNLDFHAFTDTFTGQLDALEREFKLFDITDPIEQVKRFVALLGGQGSVIFNELRNLDLGSATDRATALEKIRQLFEDAKAGKISLDQLGGLSLTEFLDALQRIHDGLVSIDGKALTPLEQFQQRLKILTESLDAAGASAAERLTKLIDFFAKEFPDQLKGITPETSLSDVRKQFVAFLAKAASDSVISDDEQAIIDAFSAIVAAMQAAADAAGQTKTQAEQDAAAARALIVTRAKQGLELNGVTDPAAVQDALLKAYEQAIPKLGDILGHTAGDTLQAKFGEIFKELDDGSLSLDALGIPLDEFLAALLDISSAGKTATESLAGLADALSAAFSEIDLDARIAGDSIEKSLTKKLAALGISADVTGDAGRQKAISDLQALAAANPTDDKLKELIANLLDSIRGLSDAVAPGGAAGGGGGSTSAVANAAQSLTEATGNRMADYLATLIIIGREEVERLSAVASAVTGFLGASVAASVNTPKLSPPSLPASFGAAGPVSLSLTFGDITNTFTGPVTAEGIAAAEDRLTRQFLRRVATEVSKLIAGDVVTARRLAGQVSG